ncbi:PucR family transcriptional regulator [Nocardiopsis sediminis]|uniref:PucR family transcriptional regulator n=1 Tax=Nocardiopsis sediminis TaxID=1778267 RepID=A0ABV8FJ43_9ACTN
MQISELVAIPRLRLRLLGGAGHAHRAIRRVYTTDLLRPGRYLSGGELVLTGMMWHTGPEDSETFVGALAEAGAACLAAGTALGEVPADLVTACEKHGLPLLEVPAETSFGAVTEEVLRLLDRRRYAALAEDRHRQRRLMAEVAAGADFPGVFVAAAAAAGIRACVLSSTGRTVAAGGLEPVAPDREQVAAHALAAAPLTRCTVQIGVREAAPRTVTALQVRTRSFHPLAGWSLVCDGDHTAWSEETHEAVAELLSLTVLARSREEELALSDARHAEGLPRLLAERRFDEVVSLLRLTRPDTEDAGDGPDDPGLVVVSAALLPQAHPPDLARRITAELVAAAPGAVVTGGAEALAVAAAPGDGHPGPAGLHGDLARAARVLRAGLGGHRLVVGVSSAVRDVAGLRGAAVEAGHARRLAELRGGPTAIVTGAEIDTHDLLLASVPDDVRSAYRDRLLGPLVDYDRAHRSDLVETLERFLRYSGSWQRCAQAMHVHVNTLRYRIGRVEELTGRDLSRLDHRVDLLLALKLRA